MVPFADAPSSGAVPTVRRRAGSRRAGRSGYRKPKAAQDIMETPPTAPPRHSRGDDRIGRIARFPLTWMAAGILAVAVMSPITTIGGEGPWATVVVPLLVSVVTMRVYRSVMRYVAHRRTPEMAARRSVRDALLGAAIGLGFAAVSVGVVAGLGGYTFTWAPDSAPAVAGAVAPVLATAVAAAVTAELIYRGLALQAVERLVGSWIALAVTAALFGLVQLVYPAGGAAGAAAVAVHAGVLLGAAFLWRRSIWFVVALHFAWNAAVGLLGIPMSGEASPGLLAAEATGPAWLTGGGFGLEASAVPVVVSLLITVPMLAAAHRRGALLPM